jgi:hypothetical protein
LKTLTFEGGMRLQADLASAQSTYALRGAASYSLPTATVLKVSFGMATQFQPNPVLLDASYGNPDLDPERTRQIVVGLEQPLPFEALVIFAIVLLNGILGFVQEERAEHSVAALRAMAAAGRIRLERTHFDLALAGLGALGRPGEGGVEVGDVDDPEAADVLLGLEVRAVGDDGLARGGIDHGRGLGRHQTVGVHPGAGLTDLFVERLDVGEHLLHRVGIDRCVGLFAAVD